MGHGEHQNLNLLGRFQKSGALVGGSHHKEHRKGVLRSPNGRKPPHVVM